MRPTRQAHYQVRDAFLSAVGDWLQYIAHGKDGVLFTTHDENDVPVPDLHVIAMESQRLGGSGHWAITVTTRDGQRWPFTLTLRAATG